MAKQTVTFVVDSERDCDILCWLADEPNKSAAIREVIRAYLGRGSITLLDVYEAIQDLRRGGWTAAPEAESHTLADIEEPPDVAAALNSLGL